MKSLKQKLWNDKEISKHSKNISWYYAGLFKSVEKFDIRHHTYEKVRTLKVIAGRTL